MIAGGARARRGALGAAAGLVGALAGHWAVWAARWATGDADIWLKGEHGPAFFELALSTGAYFGCLGAALASGWRERLRAAAAAGAASFFGVALPMMLGTHVFAWGEGASEPTWAWIYLVLGSYTAACSLGTWVTGRWVAGRGRPALWALAGMLAAYAVDRVLQSLLPPADILAPVRWWPPRPALLSALLWGGAIAAALAPLPARLTDGKASP